MMQQQSSPSHIRHKHIWAGGVCFFGGYMLDRDGGFGAFPHFPPIYGILGEGRGVVMRGW